MLLTEDPLSQVLILAEARAAVSTGLSARGNWALQVPATGALKCNAIRQGRCHLVAAGRTVELAAGDCFLVAPDLPFVIGTDLDRLPRAAAEVFAGSDSRPYARLDAGPGADFLCLGGRMELPEGGAILLESLPPVTVIRAGEPAAERIGWLLNRLETETATEAPGAAAMAAQIMQMVFIELIRSVPETDGSGWLAALSDPRIGAALRAMHREPGYNWQLEDLAEISHLSRSRFAARFRASVGRSPIEYLTNLRMMLARKALARPGASVSTVAAELGYASESAFSFAFRRVTGTTPRQAAREAA